MQELNLPRYSFKIQEENGKKLIFDDIRKKYLVLTPEEWVRQNFIQYLITEKEYPKTLISIEKGLKLNELQKRADAVVYNQSAQPIVLIECKAPHVKITQKTFEQIARYNMIFKVPYLVVTNGLNHYCCQISFEKNSFNFLEKIPTYTSIK